MSARRAFMKIAAAALPASAVTIAADLTSDFQVREANPAGAWTSLHTSPLGPFREFLLFGEGGAFTETNALLHTNSNLSFFANFGLPAIVNGSDGFGTWTRLGHSSIRVAFRKLLFDGDRQNFGSFSVRGTLKFEGATLRANWTQIWVVGTADELLLDLGPAQSEGSRIG